MEPFALVVQAGVDLLTKRGVEVTPETIAAVKEAAQAFVSVVDGHAKKHAEAAGKAAADKLTTEDAAELAQRNRK